MHTWTRRLQLCHSGSNGSSLVIKDDPRRERGGGLNHVTTDGRDKHDNLGPVPSGRAGNESQIREVQCEPRGDGCGDHHLRSLAVAIPGL